MSLRAPSVKLLIILLFSVLFFLTFRESGCQSTDRNGMFDTSGQSPGNVFSDKERIRFGAYSNGIRIGSGSLLYLGEKKVQNTPCGHIVLEASTFSLKDKENIYTALDFSKPIKVEREIRILGRNEFIVEDYAPDKKSVTITKRVEGGQPTAQVVASDDDGFDHVVPFIYWIRNDKDLKVGKSYKINLPAQKLDIIVRDLRRIKVPLGTFEAYFLESSPPKYKIWLSSQGERTPLRIQGLLATGLVYLAAISVDVP